MLFDVLHALWLSFCLSSLPIPIEMVCLGASGSLRGWAVFECQECPSPPLDGKEGLMISHPKWPVLMVENWPACVTCKPLNRVLTVVLCQSPDAPAGQQVCPPQGPIGAYAVGGLDADNSLYLLLSFVCRHARTFHVIWRGNVGCPWSIVSGLLRIGLHLQPSPSHAWVSMLLSRSPPSLSETSLSYTHI